MTFDWLVGFYEGDGNPNYIQGHARTSVKKLRINIVQRERWVLEKCRRFLKTQGILAHVWPRRRKPCSWVLAVDEPHSRALAGMMLPLMHSTTKKKQLIAALQGKFFRANRT